jgi:phage terminase large subunit-like protein
VRPERKLAPDTDILALLTSLDPVARRHGIELLGPQECDALDRAWELWAHEGQRTPPGAPDGGPWSTWVIKAGRGFGKTLAGAQWVTGLVAGGQPLRFALVGATLEDARRVMVEGRSGLLEVAGTWVADWHASLGRLTFTTGAQAQLFSGATPHLLRGPEHHYAWCDELAKWDKAQECWDMLQLGLRLGRHPRALVTTTPRPGPVLTAIMAEPDTAVTGGPTRANPHLPSVWKRRVERLYAGTRLGRQELDGELLPDAAGALWSVELIERCRLKSSPSLLGEGDRSPKARGGGAADEVGGAASENPSTIRCADGPPPRDKLGEDS